jgi:hypothetical protein
MEVRTAGMETSLAACAVSHSLSSQRWVVPWRRTVVFFIVVVSSDIAGFLGMTVLYFIE